MLSDVRDKLRAIFASRQQNYKRTFHGPVAREVLRDLAKFCRANKSVFDESQRATDIAIGRNEVWLRIANHLELSQDELFRLTFGED